MDNKIPSHTPNTHKITITVTEIEGTCSAGFKVGDKIVIKRPRICLNETDNLCINALSAMMPYIRQWSSEPFPPNARSIIHCPDAGPMRGGHGSVIFKIKSEKLR